MPRTDGEARIRLPGSRGWVGVTLSQRLAALAAAMAIVLVLGTTELTLWWTRSSRLNDLRVESEALAEAWAAYLGRSEAPIDPTAAAQLLASWPTRHLTSTSAALFSRSGGRFVRMASSDSLILAAGPHDSLAFATRETEVWRVDEPTPSWRVATPVGNHSVLSISVSTRTLDNQARAERKRAYLFGVFAAVALALGIGYLVRRWVGDPLGRLEAAMEETRRHGLGPLSRVIVPSGPSELQRVAARYQDLEDTLRARQREMALEERTRGLERVALAEQAAAEFAHEVGTPLSTLNGHLQLLREDLQAARPGEGSHRVDAVLRQVDRLSSIVRAKQTRGPWDDLKLRAADLTAEVRSVAAFMEPTFREARVLLDVRDPNGAGPVLAECDPNVLEQILVNLFKNATEAMPNGGTVRVVVGQSDGTAWVSIADNGPGLSLAARAGLFQPFNSTKGVAGTGLGLVISRRLARAMGGDLELVPSDEGTTWKILLAAASRGSTG